MCVLIHISTYVDMNRNKLQKIAPVLALLQHIARKWFKSDEPVVCCWGPSSMQLGFRGWGSFLETLANGQWMVWFIGALIEIQATLIFLFSWGLKVFALKVSLVYSNNCVFSLKESFSLGPNQCCMVWCVPFLNRVPFVLLPRRLCS